VEESVAPAQEEESKPVAEAPPSEPTEQKVESQEVLPETAPDTNVEEELVKLPKLKLFFCV
jgi:hypothetical protein